MFRYLRKLIGFIPYHPAFMIHPIACCPACAAIARFRAIARELPRVRSYVSRVEAENRCLKLDLDFAADQVDRRWRANLVVSESDIPY
jgi:hypothetical protein